MALSKDGRNKMELVSSRPTISSKEWQILNNIAQQSQERAATLVDHFFSATDDLFYELSERASTNNEENLYFEAMRAIRVNKKQLENEYLDSIISNFKDLPQLSPNERKQNTEDEELSILGREELEMDLAQKNMSDRTRDTYKNEIYELESRLDHLTQNCTVTQFNNPLDPFSLSKGFVSASNKYLKLDIKTRLIFFKLFEKHVLKQLGHLYFDANEILVNAGILPKVPRKAASQEGEGNEEDSAPHASAIEEQAANTKFDTFESPRPFQLESSALSALMASIRSARSSNAPGVQSLGNYHYFSANPGAVMPAPELATFLTDTQKNIDDRLSSETPQNLVPQIISDILALKNPSEPQALDQPDEDIINLVALFFDKVLEDENIPIAVQSLICRLQIPVLKIALHDKTFLTNEQHPVRLLINTITQAGLSFDESKPIERDPLYKVLTEGVQKINQQFKLEDVVFTEVEASIKDALQNEAKKANVVESRTQQTETGKAKLSAARSFAQNTLYEKLKEITLPIEINNFLTGTWLQVMIITFVRNGKECAAWVQNEQLITDLTWVAQRYEDEKSTLRQQRLLPEVLQTIENGLALVIDNEDMRHAKVEKICETLEAITAGAITTGSYQELNDEQKSKLGKTDPQTKSWEDMTALERQKASYDELSSKYYLDAKNMPVNTWLTYLDQQKGKEIRCKLSVKIDAENYIFVNRLGFKTLIKTRRQFAYDMQFKKAVPLDSTPIFERLMDKVVKQIRSISNEL